MPAVATREEKLFINGEWTGAVDGKTYQKRNPYTGGTASQVPAGKREDARRAIDAAAAAFPAWSATAPGVRRDLLLKAAEVLERKMQDIAKIMALETGQTFGWGMFNCVYTVGILKEAAGQPYAHDRRSDSHGFAGHDGDGDPSTGGSGCGHRAVERADDSGNAGRGRSNRLRKYCGAQGVGRISGHASGDRVDFRGSRLSKGVVNVITNAPADAAEVVDELIANPKTRRVSFTGSTKIGRLIAESAGRHLKRVVLELGGKAPMVVLGDADIDAAVSAANFGAFMNQGQICMSTERIVVDKSIADEFAKKLAAKGSALKMGDPMDPQSQIGCMITTGALERVQALVDDAVAKGAKVLCGGKAQGPCYPPTVVYGVTPAMRMYHEESFGPAKPVVFANNAEEALRIANDTTTVFRARSSRAM